MPTTITAEEIKGIRGQYGLTQKSFAQVLGLGIASLIRYEQGDPPSKANANLIRAARHPEFMLECLEREGSSIPERQRDNATKVIYALISLDPEEGDALMKNAQAQNEEINEMDAFYHYTLQQEVLNEQAANIIGEIISIKISTGFNEPAATVFENLLDQVAELKPLIISRENMDDEKLSRIGGYLSCAGDLLKRRVMECAK